MRQNLSINDRIEAGIIFNLIKLAREWSKNKCFSESLASVLIYANLAEFLAESILSIIQIAINSNMNGTKCRLDILSDKGRPTHLEALIRQLNLFDFFLKKEILLLLKNIKDSRNKLFHNLLTAEEKELHPDKLIKQIQSDVEELFILWSKFCKEYDL